MKVLLKRSSAAVKTSKVSANNPQKCSSALPDWLPDADIWTASESQSSPLAMELVKREGRRRLGPAWPKPSRGFKNKSHLILGAIKGHREHNLSEIKRFIFSYSAYFPPFKGQKKRNKNTGQAFYFLFFHHLILRGRDCQIVTFLSALSSNPACRNRKVHL